MKHIRICLIRHRLICQFAQSVTFLVVLTEFIPFVYICVRLIRQFAQFVIFAGPDRISIFGVHLSLPISSFNSSIWLLCLSSSFSCSANMPFSVSLMF